MIDFVLPSLGADMDQAMLVAWLVEPGDEVGYGQIVAEVETDKGVIEIECWHDCVFEELLVEPGPDKLPVGTPLARIMPLADEPERIAPSASTAPADTRPVSRAKAPSPPMRHLAHTLGVDLARVSGTGAGGEITRADVRAAAPMRGESTPVPAKSTGPARPKASPRARVLAGERGVDLTAVVPQRTDGLVTYDDVEAAVIPAGEAEEPQDKVIAMRRAISRSMSRSKREIPHYYLATRIDMARAMQWLETQNAERPITSRILPAVLLLKATALAIRGVPDLNGHWVDERFVPADAVHLGVAVSLREGGLVAPAIHHADMLSLDELMEQLRDVVTRARAWRLRGSEMSDPTITVTNLGDRGVETAFPIIIPPQVAMVGFGRVIDEVVADGGHPVVHPVVHATLAADHRVTDGHTGGLLLTALDQLLQKPEDL